MNRVIDLTCTHPNRIGLPECRCPDCGAFQDNEGRWCSSVHVTTEPCAECGVSGFHKHYLDTKEN